jgi:hypothetical protein
MYHSAAWTLNVRSAASIPRRIDPRGERFATPLPWIQLSKNALSALALPALLRRAVLDAVDEASCFLLSRSHRIYYMH